MALLLALVLFPLGFLLLLLVEGVREGEARLVRGTVAASLPFVIFLMLLTHPITRPYASVAILALWGSLLALLFPRRSSPRGTKDYIVGEVSRVDEREIPFARIRSLLPGTERYLTFYRDHPEWEGKDAERRKVGLLGPLGEIDGGYRPVASVVKAAMSLPLYLSRPEVYEPQPEGEPQEVDPSEITLRLKGLARHLGADLVGICRVDPRWVYSHRGEIFHGNWEDWGRPIKLDHPYAIVIATEMAWDLVRSAPHLPTTVESSVNYAKGAFVATVIAHYIAQLGYQVRAQHFRHYDLCLVPLAVDAGLGEVGRHGYLITDKFGSRVRLAAVTTTMPLIADQPVDLGIQQFCARCLKCARSCPSGAISRGPKEVYNGILRWRVDRERCFDYWARIGTDCALCMAVCPFSRPDTWPHRLMRWTIKKAVLPSRVLPAVDNFFYGRRWKPKGPPLWVDPHAYKATKRAKSKKRQTTKIPTSEGNR